MSTSSQFRVLVAGGTVSERDEVAQALQSDETFSVVLQEENPENKSTAGAEAEAVVRIQSALPGFRDNPLPSISLTVRGNPTPFVQRSDATRLQALSQLSQTLRRAVQDAEIVTADENSRIILESAGEDEKDLAVRALRESQRLAAIGKLTAEIAHEINNPLESVGNLIYLAMHEAGVPGRALDFLRSAERELERIVQISKQTLSFARESAEPVAVRVTEIADEVLGLYSRRISQKKLAVIREYDAQQTILALPGELRQVFSNLVTNAIEATSTGGTLRLRIRSAHQHTVLTVRSGLRISIGDTGAGIPEQVRRRLGEMFFSTKGESGTGLGLWVTRSVITRYGGTLQLRSSTGSTHGTVFSFFLPDASAGLAPWQGTEPKPGPRNVTEISHHPSHANHPQRADSTLQFRKREG